MKQKSMWIIVWVAALGYFVDVFDILLFSVVRVQSLKSLGIEGEALTTDGTLLINCQMIGMLIGGVCWGVLGDKKGRVSVLYGSILIYSLANLLNSFAVDVTQYAVLRFIAGLGLAGELGAGISLVSEVLPATSRGIGTTIVASVGVAGAMFASVLARFVDWRTAYQVASGMGFVLLTLRVATHESGFFEALKLRKDVKRGDLLMLIRSPSRVFRFLGCFSLGLPIYFVLGVLVTFAPEFGKSIGLTLTAGDAVFYSYIGFILGDLASGGLSQIFKTRKIILSVFTGATLVVSLFLLNYSFSSEASVYYTYIVLGFAAGAWAVMMATSAEQFGTNLRATVTTSVPNFVRGAVVPMTLTMGALKPEMGFRNAAMIVLAIVTVCAFLAIFNLKETFNRNLDFNEV